MTRNDVINLYDLVRNIEIQTLDEESIIQIILLRVKLKDIVKQLDEVRTDVSDQTKPKDWKEGDSTDEWNRAFQPVLIKWLNEEVDLDTKILTIGDIAKLVKENGEMIKMGVNKNIEMSLSETLMEFMLKEDI